MKIITASRYFPKSRVSLPQRCQGLKPECDPRSCARSAQDQTMKWSTFTIRTSRLPLGALHPTPHQCLAHRENLPWRKVLIWAIVVTHFNKQLQDLWASRVAYIQRWTQDNLGLSGLTSSLLAEGKRLGNWQRAETALNQWVNKQVTAL